MSSLFSLGESKVAGIGVRKGVKVALCGMKNIYLKEKKQRKFSQFIILTTKNLENENNLNNYI